MFSFFVILLGQGMLNYQYQHIQAQTSNPRVFTTLSRKYALKALQSFVKKYWMTMILSFFLKWEF